MSSDTRFISHRNSGRHSDAKTLKGFDRAGVLEVVEDHRGETYRAVYTV